MGTADLYDVCHVSSTSPSFPVVICLLFSFLMQVVAVTQNKDKGSEAASILSTVSSSHVVIGVLLVVAFLLLMVLVVPVCMDCMNREVSTDNHPACSSPATKYAGTASSNRTGDNSHYVIVEGNNAPVMRDDPPPYSLAPSYYQGQSNFAGY